MPNFRVTWEIDIEAGSPLQAARQALAIQRDPLSTATAFDVTLHAPCPSCKCYEIHLYSCKLARSYAMVEAEHRSTSGLTTPFKIDLEKESRNERIGRNK